MPGNHRGKAAFTRQAQKVVAEVLESRRLLSAQLLKDINTSHVGTDLSPYGITPAGSVAYFADSDGVNGEELWKTNGTTAGTSLVADVNPGPAGSYPGLFTTINGITYFGAQDSTNGNELWRTDGTAPGTYLVKDINPGLNNSNPSDLTAYNGNLYFFADDGVHGRELWKSDGTSAGTVLVVDTNAGSSGQANAQNGFHRLVVSGSNVLFFTAFDGTNNNLYTTTGAVGNATLVKTLQYVLQTPGLVSDTGNLVFYTDVLGYVYQSDGTYSGTITDDPTNATISSLTPVGNDLYYLRSTTLHLILNHASNVIAYSASKILGVVGNDLVYSLSTSQLWYVDALGGGYSQYMIQQGVTPIAGAAAGNNFYFVSGSSTAGYSLYESKALAPATNPIASINAGGALSAPTSLATLGSDLLFINTDSVNGTQPWVSNGTAAGTGMLEFIYPGTAGSGPVIFATLNGKVFFTANDGVTGTELYASDGTSNGTVELKDISPGSNSSSPNYFMVFGTRLYFSAYDPTDGGALWSTDGTPGGTSMLIAIGGSTARPMPLGVINGLLLFSANDTTHGNELWVTDGTFANTKLLDDINPGTGSSSPSRMVVMNGYGYFTATDATHGTELWRTDGTAAGTTLVDDIYPGSQSSSISSLFVYNNMLLFSADSNTSPSSELWRSDGTAAGTVLVKDVYPGLGSSNPTNFVAFNGLVYFAATDSTGSGLYVTDGTAGGTALIAEGNPSAPVVMDGKLYFLGAVTGQSHDNLYFSQGTSATTGIVSTTTGEILNGLATYAGRLFFLGSDPVAGYELWSSDGTAAGTGLIQDVFPGTNQGSQIPRAELNGNLYFVGDNSVTSTEPYLLPETFAPQLYAASANVATGGPDTISFSFSENVSANLSATSLQLTDLTTGQPVAVSGSGYSYNPTTNTATFSLPTAALVDGRYRATLPTNSIVDPQGNIATSAVVLEFVAVSAMSGNEQVRLSPSSDGTALQVYKQGLQTFTTPFASLGSVVVIGGSGNDSLSVTLGANLLPGGISFDGGSGTNSLSVIGTTGTHLVSTATGNLTFDTTTIGSSNTSTPVFDPAGGSDGFRLNAPLAIVPALGTGRVLPLLALGSSLDVSNNSLDLQNDSLAAVTGWAASGYAAGQWNGTGLASTAAAADPTHLTALGVIQNNQSGTALFSASRLFDGTSPGAGDVLVKFTYYGDANLDGAVSSADYVRIDNGFLTHAVGWFNGDFNYDGVINGSDYTLIDNAFNRQGPVYTAQIARPSAVFPGANATSNPIDDLTKSRRKPAPNADDAYFAGQNAV